jgi:3-isopropylmalate/(R)-2-methylmalate dehydratase large subunit
VGVDDALSLVDNISTDELTPGWVCYYYDETLARYCLVGLRGGNIKRDAIKNGGFGVIVSGRSKGCGSSRETAPYSEREAGIQLVVAKSIEKIYGQNCQNIGLLTTTDFSLLDASSAARRSRSPSSRRASTRSAPTSSSTAACSPTTRRASRRGRPPAITTPAAADDAGARRSSRARAMIDAKTGKLGVPAVKPGDALFVRTDVRFSPRVRDADGRALFRAGLGDDAKVTDPRACSRSAITSRSSTA